LLIHVKDLLTKKGRHYVDFNFFYITQYFGDGVCAAQTETSFAIADNPSATPPSSGEKSTAVLIHS
jgi:hypothetical protein